MLNLFEIYQEAFDCVCYDTESEKIIDDSVYYFNYNKITKFFKKKVINRTISYLESIKMVGRYVFSVCSCVLNGLHKKRIDYVTLPSSDIINNYSDLQRMCSCRNGLRHGYASMYCI